LPNFVNHPPDAIFQDDFANQLLYTSQWAEVAWYLFRWGSTDEPEVQFSTLGTPLYRLYRAQYLLVPNNKAANDNYDPNDSTGADVQAAFFPTLQETTHGKYLSAYAGVSCFAGMPRATDPNPKNVPLGTYLYFSSPSDVTVSGNRTLARRGESLDVSALNPAGNSTLVLGNVVSFHVRLMPVGGSSFSGDYATAEPTADFTQASKTVDSSTTTTAIRAVQILIRVWDPASQQTRQITIVQDM
jgi:hypothetical protein